MKQHVLFGSNIIRYCQWLLYTRLDVHFSCELSLYHVWSCLLSKLHYLTLWVIPTKPLVSFHTKIKRKTFILVPLCFCFFHCDIVIYLLKLKIKIKCLLNYTKYYVNKNILYNIKWYVKLFKYLILYTNTLIYL